MPVNIRWANAEQTLIHYEFIAPWTWPEYHEAIQQMETLLGSVDHSAYLINDFRQSPSVPRDFMWRLRRLLFDNQPANLDTSILIIVSPGNLIRNLMQSFARIYQTFARGRHFIMVATIEEALDQFVQLQR